MDEMISELIRQKPLTGSDLMQIRAGWRMPDFPVYGGLHDIDGKQYFLCSMARFHELRQDIADAPGKYGAVTEGQCRMAEERAMRQHVGAFTYGAVEVVASHFVVGSLDEWMAKRKAWLDAFHGTRPVFVAQYMNEPPDGVELT